MSVRHWMMVLFRYCIDVYYPVRIGLYYEEYIFSRTVNCFTVWKGETATIVALNPHMYTKSTSEGN